MSLWSTLRRDQPLDRSKAWACMAANLLLWPGLGTMAAGRLVGLVQMGISAASVVMVLCGMALYLGRWMDFESNHTPTVFNRDFFIMLAGLGLFLIAWVWSGISSILILKAAPDTKAEFRPSQPPPLAKPPTSNGPNSGSAS